MDGVLVNFEETMRKLDVTGDQMKKMPGIYRVLSPYPYAINLVDSVIGMGFDVWLATKPPTGIPWAYGDKVAWVLEHLPVLQRKIILTHDKGLLGGDKDILIDDRPHKANCENFPGFLMKFDPDSDDLSVGTTGTYNAKTVRDHLTLIMKAHKNANLTPPEGAIVE